MAGGRAEDIQQLMVKQHGREAKQATKAAVTAWLPLTWGKQLPNTCTEKPTVAEAMQKFAKANPHFVKWVSQF